MTTFKRVRRFGAWVTFLLLETIALTLVVEFNQYQNEIFAHSANMFSGNVNNFTGSVGDFFSLKKENKRLLAENARLRKQLGAQTSNPPVPPIVQPIPPEADTGRFEFIPANVISKTLLGQYNYFTINLGEKDSIFSHMGVIGDEGIVGIITNTSKHYAKVMTILHPLARISASIQGHPNFGSLYWDGENHNKMILEDIPKTVENISPGDAIITSGYSNIFPSDITIGTIDTVITKPGDNSHTIYVDLINDLAGLTYVYIVKDNRAVDLQKLEEK